MDVAFDALGATADGAAAGESARKTRGESGAGPSRDQALRIAVSRATLERLSRALLPRTSFLGLMEDLYCSRYAPLMRPPVGGDEGAASAAAVPPATLGAADVAEGAAMAEPPRVAPLPDDTSCPSVVEAHEGSTRLVEARLSRLWSRAEALRHSLEDALPIEGQLEILLQMTYEKILQTCFTPRETPSDSETNAGGHAVAHVGRALHAILRCDAASHAESALSSHHQHGFASPFTCTKHDA